MKHHDHSIRQYGQEGLNSSAPPYPYIYEKYKLLINYFIHIWAVPRDSHLLLGGLDYTNYYFMNTFPHYCINICSKSLPNKYMELNETKAIAGVPTPGSYSLCN